MLFSEIFPRKRISQLATTKYFKMEHPSGNKPADGPELEWSAIFAKDGPLNETS